MLSSSGFNAAIACCHLDGCRSEKLSWLVARRRTRWGDSGRSTQGTDRCYWLRERFSGSSAGRPWPLLCVGEELLRGREKTRKKTAGAAAVFGLRKKGTTAGLCWVELETVRRKWKASVHRAGLGCRCWRLMWVWPWLFFCERELLRGCLGWGSCEEGQEMVEPAGYPGWGRREK